MAGVLIRDTQRRGREERKGGEGRGGEGRVKTGREQSDVATARGHR